MKKSLFLGLAICMIVVAISRADDTINTTPTSMAIIDDFNEPAFNWTFSNANGLPKGATGLLAGSVTQTPLGYVGQGAALVYNFALNVHAANSWQNVNVSAVSPQINVSAATAISFWVKVTPGIHLGMVLHDSSGQTLVYRTSRPFQSTDPNVWYQEIIPVNGPDHWYSGDNNGIVHFPIDQIQIQAVDPSSPSLTAGTLYFDQVQAITNPLQVDLTSNPQATVRPPVQSKYLSDNLGVGQVNPTNTLPEAYELDQAKNASFSWVRVDLPWNVIEGRRGVYNFSKYDTFVNQAQSRNMKVLFILDYGNEIYSGQSSYYYPPVSLADIAAFGNFAQAAAARYKGKGVAYEVWNEEDQPYAWLPSPNPIQYSTLLDETLTRIHAVDPAATVIGGGIPYAQDTAFLDYPYLSTVYSSSLLKIAGQGMGIHPYRAAIFPETLTADIIEAKLITGTLPLWITEWGYSSEHYDPSNGHSPAALAWQAKMVVREFITQWLVGSPVLFYFSLIEGASDPTDYHDNLGLLYGDYKDRLSMTALRTLVAQTNGRTFSGMVPSPDSGVNILRFEGSSPLFVVWATLPNSSVSVLLPREAAGFDMYGHPLGLIPSGSTKTLLLNESDGPVYIRMP